MRARALILLAGLAVAAVVLGLELEPRLDYLALGGAIVVGGGLVSIASGLHPRRLTVPSVWFISYVAVTAIPAMFVVAEVRSPYVGRYLFAVIATLLTAPAGMLLVNVASGFSREETSAFFRSPLARRDPSASETAAFLLALAIALALSVGYFVETPVIPLLYLIRNPGSAAVLIGLREESFKVLDSPFVYFYDVVRNVLYPFLIALSLGYYLISRRLRWLVLFLFTAGIGVFYAAASIAKTPVAVIGLVTILFVYLYRNGQINGRAVLVGITTVFLFPAVVLFQSQRGLGISAGDIAVAILRRVFYVPAEVLYTYFVVVPDVIPYLHGRTIGRIQWILGESDVNIANFVFQWMFPDRISTGLSNTSFLGYLHADFGVPGILLGGAFVGVLLQGLQLWLVRRPKTVVTLAAYAYLFWAAWKINTQSLTQIMLSGGIIVIMALVGFFRQGEMFFRLTTTRPVGQPGDA